MKRPFKILMLLTSLVALGLCAGCASLMEEDPNDQQLPWATPADWEGTLPGMPR
jgi:hypothetical protein